MSAKVITACRQPPTERNAAEDPLKKKEKKAEVQGLAAPLWERSEASRQTAAAHWLKLLLHP